MCREKEREKLIQLDLRTYKSVKGCKDFSSFFLPTTDQNEVFPPHSFHTRVLVVSEKAVAVKVRQN